MSNNSTATYLEDIRIKNVFFNPKRWEGIKFNTQKLDGSVLIYFTNNASLEFSVKTSMDYPINEGLSLDAVIREGRNKLYVNADTISNKYKINKIGDITLERLNSYINMVQNASDDILKPELLLEKIFGIPNENEYILSKLTNFSIVLISGDLEVIDNKNNSTPYLRAKVM